MHPADISPPESRTSVSPMSAYADASASIACDPHYVCQPQQQQQELKHHQHALSVALASDMGINIDLDSMVETMPVVVPSMSCMEVEASGEEDAEGDEDWEHSQSQSAMVLVSSQDNAYHYSQQQPLEEKNEDYERHQSEELVVPSGGDSADDFEDSTSGSEDDDDDDEFVLNPRRARSSNAAPRRRRGSAVPAGTRSPMASYASDGDFASSSSYAVGNEGRSLRTRSARYNPYQAYSDPEAFYADQDQFDLHYGDLQQRRRYGSTSSSSSSLSPSLSSSNAASRRRVRPAPNVPVPVPVPNLTKKSRGRRVPTMESLEDLRSAASGAGKKRQSAGGKAARMYQCDVDGCGKCFARGEHLKRHVRSIHTYEKRELSFLSSRIYGPPC